MTTRRLAAILAADVAGFSAMMERDEEGTAARIRALRAEVIEPALAKYHGRLVKTTGDGFLAEFASPVEAVRSALAMSNWDNRGVPLANTDGDKTLASMQRIADVMTKERAQLWINHDKAQRDSLRLAPEFYE